MVNLEKQKLEQDTRNRIGRFVTTDSKKLNPCLHGVLGEIQKNNYPAFLCGGAVRDLILQNGTPRDLDIILGYVSNDKLEDLFSPYIKGKTGLGGIKLQIKDWSIDMWPLKNTWAFKEGIFDGNGFSDYPEITFLNIDAIAVELFSKRRKKRTIYSKGFFEAIITKTIELNFEENPAPAKCIARALYMANKYKYVLGPKLAHYIISYIKKVETEEIAEAYHRRYMNAYVTLEKLHNCMRSIKTQLRTSARNPVNVFWEQDGCYFNQRTTPETRNLLFK